MLDFSKNRLGLYLIAILKGELYTSISLLSVINIFLISHKLCIYERY